MMKSAKSLTLILTVVMSMPACTDHDIDDAPYSAMPLVEDMQPDQPSAAVDAGPDLDAVIDLGPDLIQVDAGEPPDLDSQGEEMGDAGGCESGTYLDSASRTCKVCPVFDWTCSSLEEALSYEESSSTFRFELGRDGYTAVTLHGSRMTGPGSGTSAEPITVVGSVEGQSISFDLSAYEDSTSILILSIGLTTACDEEQRVRLNVSWKPEEKTVGRALCI